MSPRKRRLLELVLDNLVWFMLLFVLAVFSLTVPNYFQLGIFANIIEASSVLGVMSIGLALVVIAGHMDLSVEVGCRAERMRSASSSVRPVSASGWSSNRHGWQFRFRWRSRSASAPSSAR